MVKTIVGKYFYGKSFSVGVDTAIKKLDLSGSRIATVDLSPLASCLQLEELSVSKNQLTKLDLSPLVKCTKLYILDIENENLSSIDLSPIEHCNELDMLVLGSSTIIMWKDREVSSEELPEVIRKSLENKG